MDQAFANCSKRLDEMADMALDAEIKDVINKTAPDPLLDQEEIQLAYARDLSLPKEKPAEDHCSPIEVSETEEEDEDEEEDEFQFDPDSSDRKTLLYAALYKWVDKNVVCASQRETTKKTDGLWRLIRSHCMYCRDNDDDCKCWNNE